MIEKVNKLKTTLVNLLIFTLLVAFSATIKAQTPTCFSKPSPLFPAVNANGQTSLETIQGVTVTRNFSGTPKVYTGDPLVYCGGSTYDDYAIVVAGNANYSPKVEYTFSKPMKSVEVWLMVLGSPAGGYDSVRISTDTGAPTFTKVYDCVQSKGGSPASLSGGVVTSVAGSANINDVAVRVTSATSFTKLIVEDIYPSGTSGVLVELCPASITPASPILTTNGSLVPDQKVCNGTPVLNSGFSTPYFRTDFREADSNFAGGTYTTEIQVKKKGSNLWENKETHTTTNRSQVHHIFTPPFSTQVEYNEATVRAKYSYVNPAKFTGTAMFYSNEVKIFVKEAKVTFLTASRTTIPSGSTAPVTFTIQGTPGAVATYTLNGGTAQTVTLAADGKATVTQNISQTTTFKVTKIKNGDCEANITDKEVQVVVPVLSTCSSKPPVQFPTTGNNGEAANNLMNGVTVRRHFTHPGNNLRKVYNFNTDNNTYCAGSSYRDYTFIMSGGGYYNAGVHYNFGTDALYSIDVWLMVMSSTSADPNNYDKVQIIATTNGGNVTFTKVYDCKGDTNGATVTSNGIVTSKGGHYTDVAIRVTATKPIESIEVVDINTAPGVPSGTLVEICPSSVKPAKLKVTSQPTPLTACTGSNHTLKAVAEVEGLSASESITYKWQKSSTPSNASSWTDVTSATGTIPADGSGEAVLNITNVTNALSGVYYRAVFDYHVMGAHHFIQNSDPVTLTLQQAPTLTSLTASPVVIPAGVATPVNFVFKGTPGATVTYKLNGGTAETLTLDSTGNYTLQKTVSQATELAVTKLANSTCTINTNNKVTVGTPGTSCSSFPAPQFAQTTESTVEMNGINVTRRLSSLNFSQAQTYPSTARVCQRTLEAGYSVLKAGTISYSFDKPITEVEVWVSGRRTSIPPSNYETIDLWGNCSFLASEFSSLHSCGSYTVDIQPYPYAFKITGGDEYVQFKMKFVSKSAFLAFSLSYSGNNDYIVEICPNSIKTKEIKIEKQPIAQTVCLGATGTKFTAEASLTSYVEGGMSVIWQQSSTPDNESSWVTVTEGTATGYVTSRQEAVLTLGTIQAAHHNRYYRALFSRISCGNYYFTKATTPVKLTVATAPTLTSLTASPTMLNPTGTTDITYTLKGTAGAVATYKLNGGAEHTVTLNASGEATVVQTGQSSTATLKVTKLANSTCTITGLTHTATVGAPGTRCENFPPPQFATTSPAVTTMNGVQVTRTVARGTSRFSGAQTYPSEAQMCQHTMMSGYPIMNQYGVEFLKYTFEEPITQAQLWISGYSPTGLENKDNLRISVNCSTGSSLYISAESCGAAFSYSDSYIVVRRNTYTQGKVNITSTKPFTEINLAYPSDGNYLAELCPTSIKKAAMAMNVQDHPTAQNTCLGATNTKFKAKVTLANLPSENITYTWQQSSTPDDESSWVSVTEGTPTGTVISGREAVLTLGTIRAEHHNRYYRAVFTYTNCGTIKKVTNSAKLTVVGASDVITINTPNYEHIQDVCNTNKVIQAKATIASGYEIKDNSFKYQLQYLNASGNWVDYSTLSNSSSGQERSFTINYATAPSSTQFRVKYSVDIKDSCTFEAYSNTFKYTKQEPTAITTQPTAPSSAYCKGATATALSVVATGQGLTYQWYSNTNNSNTGGTPITGANLSTHTPATDTAGTTYYYVKVSGNCGDKTSNAVKVEVNGINPPTVAIATKTDCPTATTTLFDMGTMVTASAGHSLKWYDTASGGIATTASPKVDRKQTAQHTVTKYVSQANAQGCESSRVEVTYIVDIATSVIPTVTAPSADLVVGCRDGAVATKVNAWLATASASTSCGTATLSHNYVAPADICATPEVEVTFTATDAFGRSATARKKVKFVSIVANNDTATVSRSAGGSIDVLANDLIGGQRASLSNVSIQITNANGSSATIDPATGNIKIPAGSVPPTTYNIKYRICDKVNTSICSAEGNLALTVTTSTIVAVNDKAKDVTFSRTQDQYVKNTAGTNDLNILDNDRLDSTEGLTVSQVDIIPTVTPSGITIETTTGKIKVPANTPVGSYEVKYKIREKGTSNQSAEATIVVVIRNAVEAVNATSTHSGKPSVNTTPTDAGSILPNIRINGNTPTIAEVTITSARPNPLPGAPSTNVPSINTTTGKVEIPKGTPAGVYTIPYSVCDKANPVTCINATAKVTVGTNTIKAIADTGAEVEKTNASQSMKNTAGTDDLNVLDNDQLENTTGLDHTQVEIITTVSAIGITINADGRVGIATNVPAGTYTLKYKIKEIGTNNQSDEATLTVVIKNKVTNQSATYTGAAATSATQPTIAGSVLDNIEVNGVRPPMTDITLRVVTPATGTTIPRLNVGTGNIEIPQGTPAGDYTIVYEVCDRATPKTCKEATATVKVTANAIVATADDFSSDIVNYSTTNTEVKRNGTALNVLSNDTLAGTTPTTAQVDIVEVTPSDARVTIAPSTGRVTVAANTSPGTYTIDYKIAEKGNANNKSSVARVTVVVKNKVEVTNNTSIHSGKPSVTNTPTDAGSILTNVKINGNTPAIGDVTITSTPPSPLPGAPSTTVPRINATTGKVEIPKGTPSGIYTIPYKVCDNATPQSCVNASAKVTVNDNDIRAVGDDYSDSSAEKSATATTLKNTSGQEVNVLSNDTLEGITIGSLTTDNVEIVDITPSNPNVTIDPATGKVTIAANTAVGQYTIKYKIKDKGTNNKSNEATVTVGVKNKVTITRTDFTGTPSTNNTPNVVGNILTNTSIDGNTPTAVSVTITVPAPATGATIVPHINTTTGDVEIPQGTPTGEYTIGYQVCDNNTPQGCATQTTKVTVTANTITAVTDDYSTFKVERATTTTLVTNTSNQPVNVLSNDILGSTTGLNTTQVEIVDISSSTPIKLNTDGTVAVLPNTAKGTYTLTYKIKEKGTTNTSATPATVTVVVINKLAVPSPNVFTGTPSTNATPNVIGDVIVDGNVKINDTPATIADVTITIDTPATAIGGAPVPEINTTTGKVEVPQNTANGEYTIAYTVCDKNAPVTCKSATATIKVGSNLLVANDDNHTNNFAPVERATSATSVKDASGNVASVLTNDKMGSRTGLDDTLVTITQTVTSPNLTLNTTTGAVEVAANTPAGIYTLKYKLTDRGNNSNVSDEATVSVIVKNKLEVDTITITPSQPSATDTPKEVGDILDGVKVNGVKPSPSGITITVTTPATAIGGAPVPVIDRTTGKVTLPKGVPAGSYSITYEVCDNAPGLAKTCKSQTVSVTVTASTIHAEKDEQATNTPFKVEKPTVATVVKNGGNDLNILDNDTLNGRTGLDTSVVTIEQVSSTSTEVNINTATGKVTVGANVVAGDYTLTYKITERGTTQSSTAQVRIAVTNRLENQNAIYTGKAATSPTTPTVAGNILTNVKINGVANPPIAEVSISVTTPATPIVSGGKIPTIDATTGEVKIPQGTPEGDYTITYKVCNKPGTHMEVCKQATATIKVGINVIEVHEDTPATGAGTVDILANDKINGTPATTNNVKVTITNDGGTGATIDSDGKVNIPSGVRPGTHTITYKVCEKDNPTNCQSGTLRVVIPSAIVLTPDGDQTIPHTGGTIDVLTNDTINGDPATTDNVSIAITDDNGTGATIDADGKIRIPNGVTPGTYTITYKVCDKNNGSICQTATVRVIVPSTIVVNPDGTPTIPRTGGTVDILGNDTINGNPATKDNVVVTITNDGGTGATVDADGKINIPSGVTPGEHTITYTVCDKNNTNTCQTGTLKVVIPSTIVVNPDNDATIPSRTGGTVDILGNDTINGNPATKDNVNVIITNDGGTGATIDTEGRVNIPSGVTPGTYTVTYKVCDKNNGNTCESGTLKVIVPSTIEVNPDGDRTIPRIGGKIDVLTNDRINGNPATTNNVIIAITDDGGTGATIDSDGKINVPGGLTPREYTITYTVCDRANPTNCQSGTQKVIISTSTIQINPDGDQTIPNTGGTIDVLTNDTINGNPATTNNVTIAITNDGGTGATIDSEGKINVPGGLTPGSSYTITYKVCDKADSNVCETGSVRVIIPTNTITLVAHDDGPWKVGTLGGLTPSILNNDTLNGSPVRPDQVNIERTNGRPALTDHFQRNEDGRISVLPQPQGLPRLVPGTYEYYYTIVDKANSSNTASAKATIIVSDFVAADDVFDFGNPNNRTLTTESVLKNDQLGNKQNPSPTTEVNLTPGTSSHSGLTMNSDGTITIASGTPNGDYTYTYTICKKDAPTECETATAYIKLHDTLEARDDDFSASPVTSIVKTVVGNVLNNTVNGSDSLAGQPISDTSLVQLSIVTDGGLTGVELATNGDISVPQGTPSGTYIVKYRICQVANMNNCKEAIVTIVVANETPLKIFNAISVNGDNQNDTFVIQGIEAYPKNTLRIFNRWGVLVYEKEGYSNSEPFKGYSNAKGVIGKDSKLPQGTYYYTLEYLDGNNRSQQKSGWLYLKAE